MTTTQATTRDDEVLMADPAPVAEVVYRIPAPPPGSGIVYIRRPGSVVGDEQ